MIVIIKEWGCFARQIRREEPALLVRSEKFGVRRRNTKKFNHGTARKITEERREGIKEFKY